jgi:hypothetical protein
MVQSQNAEQIAARYTRFAANEARSRSPLYEELALGVAGDRLALEFLAELPDAKQQPNLLFAAFRHVCGTPRDWEGFRRSLATCPNEIREVMLKRRTQTNEPARCATLLPLLALLPQPLALLEVGASAGLCLIPDRYSYRYDGVDVESGSDRGAPPPRFSCATNARTPIPRANVEVAWRMGLDLEPVHVDDDEQAAWLETLVWPGEEGRLALLRQALDVARSDPPLVVEGDLRTDVQRLAALAPKDATLVIFHSAVLAYVSSAQERTEFAETVTRIKAVWIANESPRVIPGITERAMRCCRPGEFLVTQDGEPIACSDPHGRFLRWL